MGTAAAGVAGGVTPTETRMVQRAFKFALDPTPAQAAAFAQHAGGTRYAWNWAQRVFLEALDQREGEKETSGEAQTKIPGRFEVGPMWTVFKDTAVGCRNCGRLLRQDTPPALADSARRRLAGLRRELGPRRKPALLRAVSATETALAALEAAPAGAPVWADARTLTLGCPQDGQDGLSPHQPTGVYCVRCTTPLRQVDGQWCGRDSDPLCPEGRSTGAPHDPGSEFMDWVSSVSVGSVQAVFRDHDAAVQAWFKGRRRKPKFKHKGKCQDSFQVHGGSLRQASATKVVLPKIGVVTVMSDASPHPAMARSRERGTLSVPQARLRTGEAARRLARERRRLTRERQRGDSPDGSRVAAAEARLAAAEATLAQAQRTQAATTRHMGNRRRARMLWRQARAAKPKAAALAVLLRQAREDAGLSAASAVARLNAEADTRAAAAAVAAAAGLATEAQVALTDAAGDPEKLRKARARCQYAQAKAAKAAKATAGRLDRWDEAKLTSLEAAGTATVAQAQVICAAYGLTGPQQDAILANAAQARVVRGTVSRGADGLWSLSLTAEVPVQARTLPSRTQREGGVIGVDWGVRDVATCSNGVRIPSPRHLTQALAELRAAQQALSRRLPGSARHAKARALVGLIHADVARQRETALQRATTTLVRRHSVIAVEGWDVQQVMRDGSRKLPAAVRRSRNRALADAGIGMGRAMVKYKAPVSGVTYMQTRPDAATSQTCCVHRVARTTPLPPYHDNFTSDRCPCVRDRRYNTSKSLEGWAAQELSKRGLPPGGPVTPRGGDRRPPAAPVASGRHSPVKRGASSRPP